MLFLRSIFAVNCFSSLFSICFCGDERFPFEDVTRSWEERVEDLVKRLTLEELVLQVSRGGSGDAGPAPAIPRLGIKAYAWNTECLRGDVQAGNATAFPQAIGLAATFDKDLVRDVAKVTGVEVRAKHSVFRKEGEIGDHTGLSCFSPVINIMRHPLWGRNQETYGECPFLSGKMAESFVGGLQGNHPRYIRASGGCKHFNVHGGPDNIPVSRFSFNAEVSKRDWHTTFLPQFKSCVDAGVFSLMCSYNSINGIPACANKYLLNDILRKKWGFKGYVISDEAALEMIITGHQFLQQPVDVAKACLEAGCNLELSSGRKLDAIYSFIKEGVVRGRIPEELVRERVKPLFMTRFRLGEFDPPALNPFSRINSSAILSPPHRRLALEAAKKSFVLLKNRNHFLPLNGRKESVAVLGPMANNPTQIFGDYAPDAPRAIVSTPWDALKRLGGKSKLIPGCNKTTCEKKDFHPDVIANELRISDPDLIFVCLGTGQAVESEGRDRLDMELPGEQRRILELVDEFVTSRATVGGAPRPTRVVLLVFAASPVNISAADANPRVDAILHCFFPAMATGRALSQVLTGVGGTSSVPAARLPFTWPQSLADVPAITNYSMAGATYRYSGAHALFPFGFGLSYTEFQYLTASANSTIVRSGDVVGIQTVVSNVGSYEAEEVVQLYMEWISAPVPAPKLQLAAFERVALKPGEFKKIRLTLKTSQMKLYDDAIDDFRLHAGSIKLHIGGQQPYVKRRMSSNTLKLLLVITP